MTSAPTIEWTAFVVARHGEHGAEFLDMRDGLFEFTADPTRALHFATPDSAGKALEPGWQVQMHTFRVGPGAQTRAG